VYIKKPTAQDAAGRFRAQAILLRALVSAVVATIDAAIDFPAFAIEAPVDLISLSIQSI
jgi:hypothetical protein